MPLDPARRHQIEQDAITAAWEAERFTACAVTNYIAGHYATAERAQKECDRLNAGLPLHRFVVVDTTRNM